MRNNFFDKLQKAEEDKRRKKDGGARYGNSAPQWEVAVQPT